ncbi:MAG: phosphotransferase [Chloroflexota bacterium]
MTVQAIPKSKLRTLSTVLDSQRMQQILSTYMPDDRQQIDHLETTILQHRSKRCVIRYEMTLGDGTAVNVIGKVYQQSFKGQPVYDKMQDLWQHGFHRHASDQVHIPEPVAYLPELALLLQEEIPGRTVKEHVRTSGAPAYMVQLAKGLVKLHTCGIQPSKPFRVENHLMRCHPKFQVLRLACPHLVGDIDYIVGSARRIEPQISLDEFAPIHGDFHLSQVHILGEQSWLLDFDPLCFGDPAADLGNLLVLLKGKSHKWGNVPLLINTFLNEYFRVMDPRIAKRIPLYEALTYLRRACKKLRFQQPNWQRDVEKLIAKGVRCIDQMHDGAYD